MSSFCFHFVMVLTDQHHHHHYSTKTNIWYLHCIQLLWFNIIWRNIFLSFVSNEISVALQVFCSLDMTFVDNSLSFLYSCILWRLLGSYSLSLLFFNKFYCSLRFLQYSPRTCASVLRGDHNVDFEKLICLTTNVAVFFYSDTLM